MDLAKQKLKQSPLTSSILFSLIACYDVVGDIIFLSTFGDLPYYTEVHINPRDGITSCTEPGNYYNSNTNGFSVAISFCEPNKQEPAWTTSYNEYWSDYTSDDLFTKIYGESCTAALKRKNFNGIISDYDECVNEACDGCEDSCYWELYNFHSGIYDSDSTNGFIFCDADIKMNDGYDDTEFQTTLASVLLIIIIIKESIKTFLCIVYFFSVMFQNIKVLKIAMSSPLAWIILTLSQRFRDDVIKIRQNSFVYHCIVHVFATYMFVRF